jgi:hypothetical protein
MKLPIVLALFILLMMSVFTSCDRTETVEAPWDTTPIPFVVSIITPDQPFKLYLGKTYVKGAALEKAPYPEAKVYICGADSAWKELTRLSVDTNLFVGAKNLLLLELGMTYHLKIVLNNKILRAQTTLPYDKAKFIEASCINDGEYNGYLYGKYTVFQSIKVTVKFQFPRSTECFYAITALSDNILSGGYGSLSSETTSTSGFLSCPKDSNFANLTLSTIHPLVMKYAMSHEINMQMIPSDFLGMIAGSYGGVLPRYSNIENGVGLFSCTVNDRKRIEIKK